MNPLLQVRNLKKYFQLEKELFVHAVDDVSFNVEKGEIVGLAGESGCGKTTLGRAVLRLVESESGEVLYDGKDLLKLSRAAMMPYRERMQIIFQDPLSSLDPRKNVYQLISEPLRVHGKTAGLKDKVGLLLEQVGLSRDVVGKYPHEFDGGRCQRIGIARALALQPEFIVCDEPVSALDVSIQAQVLNLLMDLREKMRLTYLFVSHNLAVVKHISDRVMVMYLGVLVETAPTREIFARPAHPYTQALLSAIPSPNLNRKVERIILSGDVPTPVNPGPGCRFRKRCWKATEICAEVAPELADIGAGHFAACHNM